MTGVVTIRRLNVLVIRIFLWLIATSAFSQLLSADSSARYDFSLPQGPYLYNRLHLEQRIEERDRYLPSAPTKSSAKQFKEVLTGLGYLLSGDSRRLDHLSRPSDQPVDINQSFGYDTELNDRLLLGTRKRTGKKGELILFDSNLDEWH